MKFSQSPPTEPGLYWYRLTESSNIHWCRVSRHHTGAIVAMPTDGGQKPVELFGRWWSDEYLKEP